MGDGSILMQVQMSNTSIGMISLRGLPTSFEVKYQFITWCHESCTPGRY